MRGGIAGAGSASLKRPFPIAIEGPSVKERKISGSSDMHHHVPKYDSRHGPTIQEVLPNESVEYIMTDTQPKSVVPPMSPFSEAVAAAVNPYLVDNSTPTKKTHRTQRQLSRCIRLQIRTICKAAHFNHLHLQGLALVSTDQHLIGSFREKTWI